MSARLSHDLEFGEVLGIDEADGLVADVDNDQVVDIAFIENFHGFDCESVFTNAHRISGHDLIQRLSQNVIIGRHLHKPAEVTVGENAHEFSTAVGDAEGAGFGAGHEREGFFDQEVLLCDGITLASAHDVAHAREQGATDGTGRMELGVILASEAAGLQNLSQAVGISAQGQR